MNRYTVITDDEMKELIICDDETFFNVPFIHCPNAYQNVEATEYWNGNDYEPEYMQGIL